MCGRVLIFFLSLGLLDETVHGSRVCLPFSCPPHHPGSTWEEGGVPCMTQHRHPATPVGTKSAYRSPVHPCDRHTLSSHPASHLCSATPFEVSPLTLLTPVSFRYILFLRLSRGALLESAPGANGANSLAVTTEPTRTQGKGWPALT